MSLEFCPTLADLYRTGRAVDDAGVVRDAGGLSTANNLAIIRSLVLKLRPKRTLEIGLATGGSALTFAATHQELGARPDRQHVAIDPNQNEWWHNLGKTLIRRAGLDDFVEVIEEPSCLALPEKMRSGETFDLAYIDGSHAFQDAMLDFYYVRYLLNPGGIVLFDDCSTRDIRELLEFIRTRIFSFKEFDLVPFRPPGGSFRYRVAKALNKVQCVAFQKISDPIDDASWQWK